MSLYAIGDIHGCAKTLDVLLDRLSPAQDDTLVFVGDYIDRGPDSKGVIDKCLALKEEFNCIFLRGNHEVFFLNYLNGNTTDQDIWHLNGGVQTLKSYTEPNGQIVIPEEHIHFVRETKLYVDTPDYFFVHAGLHPNWTVAQNIEHGSEKIFLWDRNHFNARFLAWEKPVVCGHTPHPDPVDHPQLISIDTGCVYYMYPGMGRLCGVRLPEREFVMVNYVG